MEKAKKGGKSKATSVDKKDKKQKTESKTSEKVKRVPSGYILFCKDERAGVVKSNPDMKAKEVLTELGRLWKEAPQTAKDKYNKMSEQMKTESVKEASNTANTDIKKKKEITSKPKKDDKKKKKGKTAESSDEEE